LPTQTIDHSSRKDYNEIIFNILGKLCMRISKDADFLEKIPVLGTFVGIREIIKGSKSLSDLSKRTNAIGRNVFQQATYTQERNRILRGIVSFFPFIGGALLAIYDGCFKQEEKPSTSFPFPEVWNERIDPVELRTNLRDPALIEEIFDTEVISSRVDELMKQSILKNKKTLLNDLQKIPQTHDKKELRLLKKAWLKALGTEMDCDPLAKMNFNNANIKKISFRLLEEAWIESLKNVDLGNQRVEVTRHKNGLSAISMAACFSVMAKYPQLKSKGDEEIKAIEVKNTNEFSHPLCCQSLANLLAENRTHFITLQLPSVSIDSDRAKEIAKGFFHNTHIRTIVLNGNPLGDDGALALFEGLQTPFHHPSHSDPFSLDIRYCKISNKSIDPLLQLIKNCPNKLSCYISKGDFTEEDVELLNKAIKEYNADRQPGNQISLECYY
jgi:hypothetical protein